MTDENLSWEDTVKLLRQDPEQKKLVRECYFDDPLTEAAKRFADSDEWAAVRELLHSAPGTALDIGAGRGISSFALSYDGWKVTALEPDPSLLIGAGAIRQLAKESGLAIDVVENYGESLPFDDSSFDLVYVRQVLHHAKDLFSFAREVARVLKPGGTFIATREHVISKPEDLKAFLEQHNSNNYSGCENAYLLKDYKYALTRGGLKIAKILGPSDSVINYYPTTYEEWYDIHTRPFTKVIGRNAVKATMTRDHVIGRLSLKFLSSCGTMRNNTPGRLYSFVSKKP